VTTTWWLVVVVICSTVSFLAGFALRHEMGLWNHVRRNGGAPETLDFTQRKIGL
jgi:hypothetical protein